jgi:hypothetical protein
MPAVSPVACVCAQTGLNARLTLRTADSTRTIENR